MRHVFCDHDPRFSMATTCNATGASPLPGRLLRCTTALAGEHLAVRTASREALCCIGKLEVLRRCSQASLLISADAGDVELRAPVQRSRGHGCGDAPDTEAPPRANVRLSTTMQRCLELSQRLRRSLLREPGLRVPCSRDSGAAGLLEALEAVSAEVCSGRINTAGDFGRRALACIDACQLPSAALAEVERFKAEFLLVEVPEISCASFEVELHGPAVMAEVELAVEVSTASGSAPSVSQRWAWAEAAVRPPDAQRGSAFPRVRAERLPAEAGRGAKNAGNLVFKRRVTVSEADASAMELLEALEGRGLVELLLRLDWPVLLNSRVRLCDCALTVAALCPAK